MLDGSLDGEVNSLSIFKYLLIWFRSGEYYISGGEDKELKIWHYDEGECKYLGFGHSSSISKVLISPNQEFIISVGIDGSIFFWETPIETRLPQADQNMPKWRINLFLFF